MANASLNDFVNALYRSEFEYGKKQESGTHYHRFYQQLDKPGVPEGRAIIQGRAEMFQYLPEGIVWERRQIDPERALNFFNPGKTCIVNSAGWNEFLPKNRSAVLRNMHRLIFEEGRAEHVRLKIESMLQTPYEIFGTKKPLVVMMQPGMKQWLTVLVGNCTLLAAYHMYTQTGVFACGRRMMVLVAHMPSNTDYPFLRFHGRELAKRNTTWMMCHRMPEQAGELVFPDNVQWALDNVYPASALPSID